MFLNSFSNKNILSWVVLLVFILSAETRAQSFDYKSHPKLDFSFQHLTLDLKVDPANQLLEGQAAYQVEANIGGVDSLILNAARMDIRSVQVGGNEAGYRLGNDSLFIALGETSESGKSYTVEVAYQTSPRFGVHFLSEQGAWSSSLPLTTRHWLPVADHPRVAFTTDITLSVPGNLSAMAPGKKGTEEITSVEEKQVQWQSNRPLPATALWFSVGPFRRSETSFGIKQISVAAKSRTMEQSGQQLLETAYDLLNETEKTLGVEYPFETLSIVLLDDHRWETKPYAAGLIYLYENRGDLESQLRRGIYAQWFGVFQREERWSDAEAINLYQTVLNKTLNTEPPTILEDRANPDVSVNPYHVFSTKHWNQWQKFYAVWDDTLWKQLVEQSVNTELTNGVGVKSWDDFADRWYATSGQPWYEPPQLIVDRETTRSDSIIYRVDYQYDETKGELVLEFQAQDSVVNELISLPLIQYTGSKADTMQVTFTGESDSIMLNVDPLVSYVTIDSSVRDDIKLIENKPVPFILSQLRNAESAEEKASAARQLGAHGDNPDLQLAITDLLSRKQRPQVKAALLYSLGEITRGASGTEEQFLNYLGEENTKIKEAVVSALRHYKGNTQVIQAIQNTGVQADTLSLFKQATKSLLATVDSANTTPLTNYTTDVMNSDTTGKRAIFVLKRLVEHEYVDQGEVTKRLAILLGGSFGFPIRSQALALLQKVDTNRERWSNRIENLLSDNDPRIRFIAVRAIAALELLDPGSLLKERMLDEYDGRVFYEMKKVTNQ